LQVTLCDPCLSALQALCVMRYTNIRIHYFYFYLDHSFACKLHHACLSFVSIHQIAPPLTEVADIQLQLITHLSTQRDERLSWPGWFTYSRRFTHISGHPLATGRAQDGESLLFVTGSMHKVLSEYFCWSWSDFEIFLSHNLA